MVRVRVVERCTNAAGAEKVGVPLDARMKFV
jgi:hypothetical protein